MAVRNPSCVFVLLAFLAISSSALDNNDNAGVRVALKVYEDCSSRSEGFTPCLKKKALTFMDRLSRMDAFSLMDGVNVVRQGDVQTSQPALTEEELEKELPRSGDARDSALTKMLMDKVSSFIGSRTIQISMPKISSNDLMFEEGRGKKKGGMMMGGLMMGIAAKMAALVPIAIAGLYLLAGKALIISKVALLIAGIIALKKLVSSKSSGGGHSAIASGGGWQGSGGGWDKRAFNEAQKLAYKAYAVQ